MFYFILTALALTPCRSARLFVAAACDNKYESKTAANSEMANGERHTHTHTRTTKTSQTQTQTKEIPNNLHI